MNDTDFLHLLMRHQDGTLTPDEIAALEVVMRDDPAKRQLFAETQLRSMALHDRFRQEAFRRETDTHVGPPAKTDRSVCFTWITRPITAMAAGLVIGLFSASIVWAISAPKATTERLFSLINGSFDKEQLEAGFPRQVGVWSGDEASIKNGKLRFIAPGSDSGDPGARAISCDVFQLVDLRPLRPTLHAEVDSVLELSSSFLDARPNNTQPSVTFFCQLFLFKGDASGVHLTWPNNISEVISSGSAEVTTLGSSSAAWRPLTAKALVSSKADFAVVQIAVRPNLRPAKLDGLFADDVKLTLRTQPVLPVRVVQR